MAHEKNHDYHILNPSILPFLGAIGGFTMLFGFVLAWGQRTPESVQQPYVFLIGLALVLYVMYAWWAEVVTESHVGDL